MCNKSVYCEIRVFVCIHHRLALLVMNNTNLLCLEYHDTIASKSLHLTMDCGADL